MKPLKNYRITLHFIFVFFLVIVLLMTVLLLLTNSFSLFDGKNFNHYAEVIKILFGLVGGGWVLYEYYQKENKQKEDHVNLEIEIKNDYGNISLKTSIENPTLHEKKIKYAFVIISPFQSNFLPAINKEFQINLFRTNDLITLENKISEKIYFVNETIAIIPISFYFKENIAVGNEKLTYSIPLNISNSIFKSNGDARSYDVRFFVYRDPKDVNKYHRSTHCLLRTNASLKSILGGYCENSLISDNPNKINSNEINSITIETKTTN